RLLSLCSAHLDARQQSGLTPAQWPALQQRLATLQSAADGALSATLLGVAAATISSGDDTMARRKVTSAKAAVGKAARLFNGEVVQLMSGAGTAEELMAGHCVRRLMVIDATWGDAEHHAAVLAGLMAKR